MDLHCQKDTRCKRGRQGYEKKPAMRDLLTAGVGSVDKIDTQLKIRIIGLA